MFFTRPPGLMRDVFTETLGRGTRGDDTMPLYECKLGVSSDYGGSPQLPTLFCFQMALKWTTIASTCIHAWLSCLPKKTSSTMRTVCACEIFSQGFFHACIVVIYTLNIHFEACNFIKLFFPFLWVSVMKFFRKESPWLVELTSSNWSKV